MSARYRVTGLDEASAYLPHPRPGFRWECVNALFAHSGKSQENLLGGIDAIKFRSRLTLFAHAPPAEPDPGTPRLLELNCAP